MNKCNLIKRGILLIFLGILLVSLVQAQESKSPIFSFSKSYPDYVVFLPEGKIDSVFYHAHSSIIPVIFKVNKYDLFPNKQLYRRSVEPSTKRRFGTYSLSLDRRKRFSRGAFEMEP